MCNGRVGSAAWRVVLLRSCRRRRCCLTSHSLLNSITNCSTSSSSRRLLTISFLTVTYYFFHRHQLVIGERLSCIAGVFSLLQHRYSVSWSCNQSNVFDVYLRLHLHAFSRHWTCRKCNCHLGEIWYFDGVCSLLNIIITCFATLFSSTRVWWRGKLLLFCCLSISVSYEEDRSVGHMKEWIAVAERVKWYNKEAELCHLLSLLTSLLFLAAIQMIVYITSTVWRVSWK